MSGTARAGDPWEAWPELSVFVGGTREADRRDVAGTDATGARSFARSEIFVVSLFECRVAATRAVRSKRFVRSQTGQPRWQHVWRAT